MARPSEAENFYTKALAEAAYNPAFAILDLTEAIKCDPLMIQAYQKRAELYEKMSARQKADEDSQKVTSIQFYKRGMSKAQENKPDEAISDFTHAVEADPQSFNAYYRRALARATSGDYRGAIDDLTKVISIIFPATPASPSAAVYADAYYFRALFKLQVKDYDGAIRDSDQVISLKRDYIDAYLTKGEALRKLGRLEGAISTYRDAQMHSPDDNTRSARSARSCARLSASRMRSSARRSISNMRSSVASLRAASCRASIA